MNNHERKVKLWDAINRYVVACGVDPSAHVYGNTSRQKAVVEVEAALTCGKEVTPGGRTCVEEVGHAGRCVGC